MAWRFKRSWFQASKLASPHLQPKKLHEDGVNSKFKGNPYKQEFLVLATNLLDGLCGNISADRVQLASRKSAPITLPASRAAEFNDFCM